MRHKYNSKTIGSNSGYGVMLGAVACVNCGLIKEVIKGKATYFIDDCVYLT